jgi:hypothetical protein
VSGSAKEMSGMIRAWYFPIHPMSVNIWNRGVTSATGGNIDAPRMIPRRTYLPRNSSLASA